ncbi:MAG: hypothetical protein AABZ14_00370, partial [Candidatus Margulisiibacteriota bacterium]
ATINLDKNETVTCTFTNSRPPPSVTLTKTPSVTDVCIGGTTSVTYTYVVGNTGTTSFDFVLVDDNGTPGFSFRKKQSFGNFLYG